MKNKKTIRFITIWTVFLLTSDIISHSQIVYYPKLQLLNSDPAKAKTEITEILKKSKYLVYTNGEVMTPPQKMDIKVVDDRIEVKGRAKRQNMTILK
jgi:hypothetical protein